MNIWFLYIIPSSKSCSITPHGLTCHNPCEDPFFNNRLKIDDHGGLVAVGEFDAPDTIGPDLVGEGGLVDGAEASPFEIGGYIGEEEDPADPQLPCLLQACLDQLHPDTLFSLLRSHGKGPNLRQILPADVQGAHTFYMVVLALIDMEITQVVVDLTQ